MVQTIEAFVDKLHAEGVQAGEEAAGKLREEAQVQAAAIVAEAQKQAETVVAQGKAEAAAIADRQRSELDLAARGAVLQFRDAIGKAVTALLARQVDAALTSEDFLPRLIADTVIQYAREDAHGDEQVEIRVHADSLQAVTDWALKYLSDETAERTHAHLDLKGTLKAHGFEYRVSESTVEVTVESIVEVLKEQMAPGLREVLDRALSGN